MQPVDLLRALLRVDTTNPPGREGPAVEILQSYLEDAGVETRTEADTSDRPNLIATLRGSGTGPALVLVSHTDVVAVEHDRWSRDPFGAEIADGFVWGRGALDMKGIAVMHAVALAELARSGMEPRCDVILVSVADEEAGGAFGARWLLDAHPELVGFADGRPPPLALGEGSFGLTGILEQPIMPIVRGEKTALWLSLQARATPGHGSMPPNAQALVALAQAVGSVAGFRRPRVHDVMKEQFEVLADRSTGAQRRVFQGLASGAGNVVANILRKPLRARGAIGYLLADTLTPTQMSGGYKHNVVPGEATASFDCRLLPDTDPDDVVTEVRKRTAGLGIEVEEISRQSGPVSGRSALYDVVAEVSGGMAERPLVVPSLTSGFTDLRVFRSKGAVAYGWVPLVITPELLATIHGHDERIPVEGFERAVVAMADVVRRMATA